MIMKNNLHKLNEKFGINGVLKFTEKNGLTCISVNNEFASGEVYTHGAHVASFIPKGEKDLLWMSKKSYFENNRPIRGGIPVCWPWFNAHPSDDSKPSHGFARLADWDVIKTEMMDDGSTQIILELLSNKNTLKFWPYEFELQNIITFGKELTVTLVTENCDDSPVEITAALHSYFSISNIDDISITGLENVNYIDSLDDDKQKVQENKITFDCEVDRKYINTEDICTLTDPGMKRRIIVNKKGSRCTVIWNPWIVKSQRMVDFGDEEFKEMVCIESCNAANDVITIYPGRQHSLTTILSLE